MPSFRSPYVDEATVRFAPRDERNRLVRDAQLFVGDYQARAVPVADTDPTTAIPDTVDIVPGAYDFTVRAPGRGHARLEGTALAANESRTFRMLLRENFATLVPLGVERISGSFPRRPMRITLLTVPAIEASPCVEAGHAGCWPMGFSAAGAILIESSRTTPILYDK